MKKYLLFCAFFVLAWITAMAVPTPAPVPAMPGFSTVTQSDGTTLTIQAVGDEWYSLFYTADGFVVDRGEDGDFYYVTVDGLSTVRAHDATQRDMDEISFVNANRELLSVEAVQNADFNSGKHKKLKSRGFDLKKVSVPQTESPRVPIILVEFSDKRMSNSYEELRKHYSDTQGTNSVYQYFKDQSNGKFTPQFDVFGIYTLEHPRAYYGKDGTTRDQGQSGNNGRGQVVKDAILAAGSDIDWSLYDNDGNNLVDVCIVVYAGVGQAQATSVTDALWPCRWSLDGAIGSTMYRNGKTINDFAIFNEVGGKYDSNTSMDGIGTFCHEFSHCLGLPDFYVTGSNGSASTGLGEWSIMASGCYYNGQSSNTPIGYSAFEKHFMGWMDYIEPNEGNQYTIPVLNNKSNPNDQAVVVKALYDTPNKYEQWVFEYRKKQGWDVNIPAEGVLISHYTYIYDKWNNNQANYLNQLQGAETVGSAYGKGYKNSFTSTSSPAMKAYLNEYGSDCHSNPIAVDKPVTEIKVNSDGTASLWYMKDSKPTLNTPVLEEATNVQATSFTAKWSHTTTVDCSYTLSVAKNGSTIFEQDGITAKTYTVTNLTSGATYSFKVQAVPVNSSEANQSDWSSVKSVTLPQSPTISVAPADVEFSGYATRSYTQSVNVSGINLSQNISATLIGGNGIYSIDKNTISKTADNAELNITWSPTTVGQSTAQVVLTSDGADDVTINITGIAQAATPSLATGMSTLSFTTAPTKQLTKTIPLTGSFINSNVTLTLNDPSGVFSINPTTIPAESIGEDSPVDVAVTFRSNTEGSFNGSVTMSSPGAQSITVMLKATASNGGNASDAYLDIANYASIDDAGAAVDGMMSIYKYTEDATEGCAWLTVSNYGAMKADATQGWISNSLTKPARMNWNETDVFRGSNTYFGNNTAYACDMDGQYQSFYVTNCTQVKQFATNRMSWWPLFMRIYECSQDDSGNLVPGTEPVDNIESQVYGSEKTDVITSNVLDPSKIYKVEISNDCSYMYEIAFKTGDAGAATDDPDPAMNVTPANMDFTGFAGETMTGTIAVTAENLTSDVTVALNDDQGAFTTSENSIGKNEAEAGAELIVTFNPQLAGEYAATVTLTSGTISQIVTLNGVAQAHTPVLTVTPEAITFDSYVGSEATGTFSLTGEWITDDVAISCDNDNFSVDQDNIDASMLSNGQSVTVTVTFTPQVAGNYDGTLTLTSGEISKTVTLNGVAQVHTPVLTVNPEAITFDTYIGSQATGTFILTGEWITDDVVISCNNNIFSVDQENIDASQLANGQSVTVSVTFNPQVAGDYDGTITLTSGEISKTVTLNGVASCNIVAPVAIRPLRIGSNNFTARWEACPGATSYTLRVMPKTSAPPVIPPVVDTPTLLMTETFAKCTSTVTDFLTLDSYTDNPGWTYTRVYVENGGLRIGSKYAGTLTSPALDLSESNGKVSVKVKAKAYGSDTNCQLTISCGESSQSVDIPGNTEAEYSAVLDCTAATGQNIVFKNNGTNKRVILTSVEFYSGDINATAAPALAAKTIGSETIIVTGITSTQRSVINLKKGTTYIYDVKAVYGNQESEWSNQIQVKTLSLIPIGDIIRRDTLANFLVIQDALDVIKTNSLKGMMWCKDHNTSVNPTMKNVGQIDFLRDITGEQTSDWDQSNWIMLKFPEDDGSNGIQELLEGAVGKTIAGESLMGRYIDNVNYTIEVIPENGVYSLDIIGDANYEMNHYCIANFMSSNLNVNGGNGAVGRNHNEDVYYFFMNPKIQEVCELSSAQYAGDDMFVMPSNDRMINGALKVDWSYNAEGTQYPEVGKIYRFLAVVNRTPDSKDNDNTNYIVYPLDFTASGSAVAAINTVYASGEVRKVEYVNAAGLVSDKPFSGLNIVVTRYNDGSTTVVKKLYK